LILIEAHRSLMTSKLRCYSKSDHLTHHNHKAVRDG
jgi:hypothetical protein